MAKDEKGVTDNCGVGAFESFGFGFLLDAAKLAIGVPVMVVQNKLKFVSA